jgi:thiamine-monophosphate kinase
MTVADLTERELVARIQRCLPPAPDWLLVGIGDDAAVVEPERNRVEVLTVDAIVEGIHFDRAFVPPDAIGHRALAVNLSDLAAMGAAPRLALLSMALPAALTVSDFDAIAGGLAALAARHRLHVAGGNLTRSPGPLMIDVTVVGTVKRRQALTRAGARPGDDLYVSGTIGSAAAGLARLREDPTVPSRKEQVPSHGVPSRTFQVISQEAQVTSPESQAAGARDTRPATPDLRLATPDVRLGTLDLELLARAYLFPHPRVLLGVHLGRNRAASACIDLSDGLADGAHRIAEASGVGVVIDADALPIDAAARAHFEARGQDPILQALSAGDDYELLFTVRPRTRRRLAEAERRGGVPITRVGQCTGDRAVLLRRGTDVTPVAEGYSHFARLKGSRSV